MERNITLDYTKLILSFLVVAIHIPIFWEYKLFSNLIANGLCRIAVPCFFVLNGLYINKVINDYTVFKKYIKKLFTFYLVWMIIYAPFYLFYYKDNLLTSVLLNVSNIVFGFWHLWYIIGLIGSVICLYYAKKRNMNDTKLLYLSIILFLIGWLVQKVELFYPNMEGLLGGIIRSSFPSRNFIFMGFPFVTIGYLLSKENFKPKLRKYLANHYVLILLFLLLFFETTIHFFMIGRRGFDFYLSLIVLCPSLILYLLKISKIKTLKDDFISKLSASLYFIHPLVLYLIKEAFPDFMATEQYIIIIFFSIVFGSALIYTNKSLKIFF
jgi:hypothetical protein